MFFYAVKSRITHAVFEREGVIIDERTTDYCKESIIFKNFDRHIPKDLSSHFTSGNMNKKSELLVQSISAPLDRVGYSNVYDKTITAESWRKAEIQIGVKELLLHLHENDIPTALISHHAQHEALVHTEKYQEIESLFDVRIYRDDHEASRIFNI